MVNALWMLSANALLTKVHKAVYVNHNIKVTGDSLHQEIFASLYLDKGSSYEAETNTKI